MPGLIYNSWYTGRNQAIVMMVDIKHSFHGYYLPVNTRAFMSLGVRPGGCSVAYCALLRRSLYSHSWFFHDGSSLHGPNCISDVLSAFVQCILGIYLRN